MAVNFGSPKMTQDPKTRKVGYSGPVVQLAGSLLRRVHGGQIMLSPEAYEKAKLTSIGQEKNRIEDLGAFDLPALDEPSVTQGGVSPIHV